MQNNTIGARSFSVLLSAVLAFAMCVPAAAFAAEAETGGGEGSVEASPATTVTLDKATYSVVNEEAVQATATTDPAQADASAGLKWTVSNPSIAHVDENGVIRAKKSGTCKVTCTAADGAAAQAEVRVKVTKAAAKEVPVITYHRIASNRAKRRFYSHSSLAVSAGTFKKHMGWLKKNKYMTVSMDDFISWRLYKTFLPKKCVLVTIDDGFYETYHVAWPILKKNGQKATNFIIGARTKKTTPKYKPNSSKNRYVGRDVIKKLRAEGAGLEFQSHTYKMHNKKKGKTPAVKWRSYEYIVKDFLKEDRYDVSALAYPFGVTSSKVLKAAKESKTIKVAFVYPNNRAAKQTTNRYKIPRFKINGVSTSFAQFKRIVSKHRR